MIVYNPELLTVANRTVIPSIEKYPEPSIRGISGRQRRRISIEKKQFAIFPFLITVCWIKSAHIS